MDRSYKEVKFDEYCKTCAFETTPEEREPCGECLSNPVNLHSHKPMYWKENRKKMIENYITKISELSDHRGNFLVELMNSYNAQSLRQITQEQAKDFYERLIRNENRS